MTTSKDRAFVEFAQTVMDRHRALGLEYPPVLKQNGPDSDIIALEFHSTNAATAWAKWFGLDPLEPAPHPVLPVQVIHYAVDYHGWHLQISGRERIKETV